MKGKMTCINRIPFTDRELDVISCLVCGKTTKIIASLLKISPNTVNVHVRNIAFKIKKTSKNDIIKFAENSAEYAELRQRYDSLAGNEILGNFSGEISRVDTQKVGLFILAILLIAALFWFFCGENTPLLKSLNASVSEDILLKRTDIYERIDSTLKHDGINHVILVGEGGIGKSTIARSYLKSKTANVIFEINGGSKSVAQQSMHELAHLLATDDQYRNDINFIENISNKVTKNKKLVQFVANRLKHLKNWYILFDDVSSFGDIQDCYPVDSGIWGNGTVLITTRNSHLCDTALLKNKNTIEVNMLSVSEKLELFGKITQRREKISTLDTIPPTPLDVCTAAYYVKSSKTSISDYVNSLCSKNVDPFTQNMLNTALGYSKTRYSIVTTSFDKIIEENLQSRDLLFFICLLNSKNIPIRFLTKLADANVVNDFIFLLRKYSLAKVDVDKLTIHQVTQQIGRQYLAESLAENNKSDLLDRIVKVMTAYDELIWYYYDNPNYQMNYKELNEIIPHLEQLKKNIKEFKLSNAEYYEQRIDLALLYALAPEATKAEIRRYAYKILQRGHVTGYDLAALMLEYVHCGMDELSSEDELILQRCMKICKEIKADNLLAIAESYLATYYCSNNKTDLCKKLLWHAMSMTNSLKTRLLLSFRYCFNYLQMSASKDEIYSAIRFTLDTLKMLNADSFFHMINKDYDDLKGESKNCIAALRRILVALYNSVDRLEESTKNYREALFFYTKRKEKESSNPIGLITSLNIEYSDTLIKQNKILEADVLLDDTIKSKLKRNDERSMFRAYVQRSKVDIKLKKWKKAKKDCEMAVKYHPDSYFKRVQLMDLLLLYNQLVADVHLGNTIDAKMYLDKISLLASGLTHKQIDSEKTSLNDLVEVILSIFAENFGKDSLMFKSYLLPISNELLSVPPKQ